jgi:hypothetical protein
MAKRKNPAAVALSRLGAKKGGHARAAKLTPAQRSESARKAVQARWANAKSGSGHIVAKRANLGSTNMDARNVNEFRAKIDEAAASTADTSDQALLSLLKRIKATNDRTEIRRLSDQIERAIFHKQYENS